MSRGAATFKQSDLTRALKAARDAGVTIARVEIDKAGKIVVIAGTPKNDDDRGGENEWDRES